MNSERSYTPNVFQIYKQVGRVPFAVARKSWHGNYIAVVIKVIPKDDYGIAYGFPVSNGIPNDFFASDPKWRNEMVMPNAGSYQWRLVETSDKTLNDLIEKFYSTIGSRYGFFSAVDDKKREKEYLDSLIKLE
jgi:hypothetical protein